MGKSKGLRNYRFITQTVKYKCDNRDCGYEIWAHIACGPQAGPCGKCYNQDPKLVGDPRAIRGIFKCVKMPTKKERYYEQRPGSHTKGSYRS